jgi:hypothetical protein
MRILGGRRKRTAGLLAIAVVSCWIGQGAQELAAAQPTRGTPMVVKVTESEIVATLPKGQVARVAWSALTKVVLRTTDGGPFVPDMFWLFYTGSDKPALVVVGGADDQDLLAALQKRLPGFNNDQLIKAMQSVDNHTFLLWEKPATPPAAAKPPR